MREMREQDRHPECAHQHCAPVHSMDNILIFEKNKHRHTESGKLRCAQVYIECDKPQGGEFNAETQRRRGAQEGRWG